MYSQTKILKIKDFFFNFISLLTRNKMYICKFIASLSLLFLYAYFSILAGGFIVNKTNLLFTVLFFLFPLLFFNYQSFKILILIHGIISVLYFPTGRIWGRVNENILSSFIATNFSEATDFFTLIPFRYYVEQIVFLIIIFFLLKLTKSIKEL